MTKKATKPRFVVMVKSILTDKIAAKIVGEYKHVKDLPPPTQQRRRPGQRGPEPPTKKPRIEDAEDEKAGV